MEAVDGSAPRALSHGSLAFVGLRPGCYTWIWAPQFRRGGSGLERGHWRAARLGWGLEQVRCEERLSLLSLGRRGL